MIFSERDIYREKNHDKLDTTRGIRTIVNIQYTINKKTRTLSVRCCQKSVPESEERDESVLIEYRFTTLPLTTTTGHHLTITYQLSSPSTLEGLRHIALSLVSGDVVRADDGQPRRRLNPETACQQWSDRIKTHCASSPAHVRTKRLQHYPWRTTPWSRYRYAYESACESDSNLCDSLVPVYDSSFLPCFPFEQLFENVW